MTSIKEVEEYPNKWKDINVYGLGRRRDYRHVF